MGRIAITKQDMATAYNISGATLIKWLKHLKVHDKTEKFLSPKQISALEEHYGEPDYDRIPTNKKQK